MAKLIEFAIETYRLVDSVPCMDDRTLLDLSSQLDFSIRHLRLLRLTVDGVLVSRAGTVERAREARRDGTATGSLTCAPVK